MTTYCRENTGLVAGVGFISRFCLKYNHDSPSQQRMNITQSASRRFLMLSLDPHLSSSAAVLLTDKKKLWAMRDKWVSLRSGTFIESLERSEMMLLLLFSFSALDLEMKQWLDRTIQLIFWKAKGPHFNSSQIIQTPRTGDVNFNIYECGYWPNWRKVRGSVVNEFRGWWQYMNYLWSELLTESL